MAIVSRCTAFQSKRTIVFSISEPRSAAVTTPHRSRAISTDAYVTAAKGRFLAQKARTSRARCAHAERRGGQTPSPPEPARLCPAGAEERDRQRDSQERGLAR